MGRVTRVVRGDLKVVGDLTRKTAEIVERMKEQGGTNIQEAHNWDKCEATVSGEFEEPELAALSLPGSSTF